MCVCVVCVLCASASGCQYVEAAQTGNLRCVCVCVCVAQAPEAAVDTEAMRARKLFVFGQNHILYVHIALLLLCHFGTHTEKHAGHNAQLVCAHALICVSALHARMHSPRQHT